MNAVFLHKDRMMANVQKHNICTNVPSSQTFRSYPLVELFYFSDLAQTAGWPPVRLLIDHCLQLGDVPDTPHPQDVRSPVTKAELCTR
jgi:hypothetical protein